MNKWLEILLGLVILIGTIIVGVMSSAHHWVLLGKDLNFLHAAWIFLKGGLFWFAILIGIIFILIGISELED